MYMVDTKCGVKSVSCKSPSGFPLTGWSFLFSLPTASSAHYYVKQTYITSSLANIHHGILLRCMPRYGDNDDCWSTSHEGGHIRTAEWHALKYCGDIDGWSHSSRIWRLRPQVTALLCFPYLSLCPRHLRSSTSSLEEILDASRTIILVLLTFGAPNYRYNDNAGNYEMSLKLGALVAVSTDSSYKSRDTENREQIQKWHISKKCLTTKIQTKTNRGSTYSTKWIFAKISSIS